MAQFKCEDCGTIFDGSLSSCPNCGCPLSACKEYQASTSPHVEPNPTSQEHSETPTEITSSYVLNKDWAQFVYECGVLYWETISTKYATFTGRASRTEFWSFTIISLLCGLSTGIGVFLLLLPAIGVAIRRMHDINKCGWWSICPIACFFLFLKKSDEGANKYGLPTNYNHIFS